MTKRGFLTTLFALLGLAGARSVSRAAFCPGYVGPIYCSDMMAREDIPPPRRVYRYKRIGEFRHGKPALRWYWVEPTEVVTGDAFQVEGVTGTFWATGPAEWHSGLSAWRIPAREVVPTEMPLS